jgi:aspartyl-tRNA(Asn)/glutamyl-tRNA(Gln) amidotransferase subunit C
MEIKEIENLANLCRIDLSEDEKLELLDEMGSILSFIDQVQSIKLADKKDDVGKLKNIMREDKDPHTGGEYTEVILGEAPKKEGGYFKVKKIL